MTTQSFRRILELLEQHGVEYVVVGGVAAVLQGAPVTTFDIDALIRIDPSNIDRLAKVLTLLNARYREHRDLRPTPTDLAAGGHFLLMTDSGPLDILGYIGSGKRYEDVADSARQMPIGDMSIKVLSIESLIEDKKALGRDKDLAAVRLLEAVLSRRKRS
jgi:predicted nucleotidyltransferase